MRLSRRARSPAAALGRDFGKLWAALSVSLMGSKITALALPLIAAITLGASPLQMGLLAAAGQFPFLLFSLPAGVWIDRRRRRPVLIGADVGSAALLLSVPLATLFGGPGMMQLYWVAFGVGTLTVVSELAHYAYVPTLVGREHLTACNSRLQISHSAASAAGPGLGGALVQVLSAPVAVLVDAASFLVSAVFLRSIRKPEPPPSASQLPPLRRSMVDGIRFLLRHPLLRPIVLTSAATGIFGAGFLALYVLFATRELGLSPAVIGLVFAIGGAAAIPGALAARWAGDRFGVGPVIIGGWTLAGVASLIVPFASGPPFAVTAILSTSKALEGATDTIANIQQWSLRQTVTPDEVAGRVTAGHRFVVYGAEAGGALLGGQLGALVGLREALVVCAVGALLAPASAVFSRLRYLRQAPVRPDELSTGETG
jgi:MFS family permease